MRLLLNSIRNNSPTPENLPDRKTEPYPHKWRAEIGMLGSCSQTFPLHILKSICFNPKTLFRNNGAKLKFLLNKVKYESIRNFLAYLKLKNHCSDNFSKVFCLLMKNSQHIFPIHFYSSGMFFKTGTWKIYEQWLEEPTYWLPSGLSRQKT